MDFITSHWDVLAALAGGLLSLLTLWSKHKQTCAALEKQHEAKLAELKATRDLGAQNHAHSSIGKREDLVFHAITSQALSTSEWMERALRSEASDRQRGLELETMRTQVSRLLEILEQLEAEDNRDERTKLILAALTDASARKWQLPTPPATAPDEAPPPEPEDSTDAVSDH